MNFSIGRSTYRDMEHVKRALDIAQKKFRPLWLKALHDAADIAQKHFGRQFATEGGEFGMNWPALAPATQKDRLRKKYKPAGPILVRRGWLRASVVHKRSANHRREITVNGIKLYSTLKTKRGGHNLLLIHQKGTGKIPARKIYDESKFISQQGWEEIKMRFMGMFIELRMEMEKA